MLLDKKERQNTALAYGILFVLGLSPAALAQDSDESTTSSSEAEEHQKRMQQSQMSVPELIKEGVIEDTRTQNSSENEQPYSPTPEEMQRQSDAARGGRQYESPPQSTQPRSYIPPTGPALQKPSAAKPLAEPAAFAGYSFPQPSPFEQSPNSPQTPGVAKPPQIPNTTPAATSTPPVEKKKSVTEGF